MAMAGRILLHMDEFNKWVFASNCMVSHRLSRSMMIKQIKFITVFKFGPTSNPWLLASVYSYLLFKTKEMLTQIKQNSTYRE